MKGEFGTFLALTGLPITGVDAVNVDLARGIVHEPEEYNQEISDHLMSMPMPFIGGAEQFKRGKMNEYRRNMSTWSTQNYIEQNAEYNLRMEDATRHAHQRRNMG